MSKKIESYEDVENDKFRCVECGHMVDWSRGCADDMPNVCDDCWAKLPKKIKALDWEDLREVWLADSLSSMGELEMWPMEWHRAAVLALMVAKWSRECRGYAWRVYTTFVSCPVDDEELFVSYRLAARYKDRLDRASFNEEADRIYNRFIELYREEYEMMPDIEGVEVV